MKKIIGRTLAALGIAVSAAVPVALPSSLEAMMIVPCAKREMVTVMQNPDYPASLNYLNFNVPKSRRVERGDTLWEISKQEYGTPWAYGALAIINHIKEPGEIKVGQVLTFPTRPRVIKTLYREGGVGLCPVGDEFEHSFRQVTIGTDEYCNLFGPQCIVANAGYCVSSGAGNCDSYPLSEIPEK